MIFFALVAFFLIIAYIIMVLNNWTRNRILIPSPVSYLIHLATASSILLSAYGILQLVFCFSTYPVI